MTQERWEQVKQVLGEALEREAGERDAFVAEACQDDPELFAEVLALLAEHNRESGLLSRPAVAGTRALAIEELPRFAPSAVLAQRFRIVRFIARGGMGEVYEAEDIELGERVALKAIRERVAPDADMRAMFKQEIQLARRVTHPNVCRIFDLAQHVDPASGSSTLLLSMELIAGQTLAERLRLNGPMVFGDALPLIEEIAAGLQAVHDAGIIHGDLKPGNVMLVSRPGDSATYAVVMDFGMAQAAGQPEVPPSPMLRGGTPEYFAPEQRQGGPATIATDIYAFARVITDMLGVPRPIPLKLYARRMPQRCVRMLRRCLETDPARRYARPADMAKALRASGHARWRNAWISAAAIAVLVVVLAANRLDLFHGTANRLLLSEASELTVHCPSPDGKLLAATSWDTGNLILSEIPGGKVRQLTNKNTSWLSHPGGAYGARFSPDGLQIAYQWLNSRTDGELRLIGTNGKGDRTLYRNPDEAATLLDWSPNGGQILIRLRGNGNAPRLALLNPRDGSVQVLPKQPSVAVLGRALFWKDGNGIVFDANAAQSALEIRRLTLEGTESTLVGRTGSNSIIGWSPDRHRLIFASDRRGQSGIWSVPVSGLGAAAEPKELVTNAPQWEVLGITRTGSLLYRHEADSKDVYTAVLDLAANRTISPPKRVTERFTGSFDYPNWSPDGRLLVFDSNRDMPTPGLAIFEPQTGTMRELRLDLAYSWRPQWVEHGTVIMVAGAAKDGLQGQFRVDPRGGQATLFLTSKDLETAGEGIWSADRKIHFNRYRDYRRGIFRLNVESGERRVLYVPPPGVDLGAENLALSPDGRTLAFQQRNDSEGTAALMLIPGEGGEARPLFTIRRPEVFWYGSFTWAPDSRRILVSRSSGVNPKTGDRVSEIWQVPVDGTSPSKIEFPSMWIPWLRLSPDGKTIAFSTRRFRREVWMLQNFL